MTRDRQPAALPASSRTMSPSCATPGWSASSRWRGGACRGPPIRRPSHYQYPQCRKRHCRRWQARKFAGSALTSFCEYACAKPPEGADWSPFRRIAAGVFPASGRPTAPAHQANPIEGEHELFGSSLRPNDVRADPSQGDASVLTTLDTFDVDDAPADSVKLQRPLPDGAVVVATGSQRMRE